MPFAFDRLGVRVPSILVSPWIAKGTVVPGPEDPANGRVFEHASIPATITQHFIGNYDNRTPREKAAQTFLDLLTDEMRPDSDCRPSSSNRRYLDGTAASDPRSKPARSSYQPNRPLSKSSLLQSQVKHFATWRRISARAADRHPH